MRDSGFFGAPVVLVGTRQNGREFSENVICVELKEEEIINAAKNQINNGKFPISDLYGNGNASQKLVNILKTIKPKHLKRFSFYDQNTRASRLL